MRWREYVRWWPLVLISAPITRALFKQLYGSRIHVILTDLPIPPFEIITSTTSVQYMHLGQSTYLRLTTLKKWKTKL